MPAIKRNTNFIKIQLGLMAFEALIGAMFLILMPLEDMDPTIQATSVRQIGFLVLFILFWFFYIVSNMSDKKATALIRWINKKLNIYWTTAFFLSIAGAIILYFLHWNTQVRELIQNQSIPWSTAPLWGWLLLFNLHLVFLSLRFAGKSQPEH